MKIINLRLYYPHYQQDKLVEVSEEVFDVLCQSVREMRNYERRKRYQRSGFDLERWRREMSELCHRWQSEGYGAFFTAAALADGGTPDPDKLQKALEQTAAQFESAALEVRKLCERYSTGTGGYGSRPVLPPMEIAGSVELLGYNWLHITLNTLLPHCRFQPPEWLSDTIRRLLDEYEAQGCKLPFFNRALLVIDEFTGIQGRHIFDQDNKGWKAVSNAIKGRLIPDDDQHTLAVALLSGWSELDVCHITLLDLSDAADFFAFHSGDYEVKHFYDGGWA